jgi:RNA polymerase sigma-70 factor (ECF subfamily)
MDAPPPSSPEPATANPADRLERFQALASGEVPGVVRYLFGMTGDRELAEDLAQETFLRAWVNLDSVRSSASVRGWLYTIATNLARRHLRRSSRLGSLQIEALRRDAPRHLAEDLPDTSLDLERALGIVSADDRAILLLVGLEGLTLPEAAAALGISLAAAKKRWQRACGRMDRALQDGSRT